MISGTIFDIKSFAIHDGPGVRTTVFFKGCPLNCWACHNPEGQDVGSDLLIRDERCRLCGDCLDVCQRDAISQNGDGVQVDRLRCDLCGACADACLRGALEIAGKSVEVDAVMRQIERDVVYYDESGGGVTFSGGEPLAQPDFLLALLTECTKRDISTVVDTSGYAPLPVVRAVVDLVDLFLYDLKLVDSDRHKEFTGVPNGPILENVSWLSEHGSRLTVRLPLIPDVNDDKDNLSALGSFLSSLPRSHRIDILPYHRTGVDKYVRLGRGYHLSDKQPPSEERVTTAVQLLEQAGLNVTVRGESHAFEQ